MSLNITDIELINSYKEGNQNALKILIERYTSPLYNFIARIAHQSDAEDILANTFIKVWKNLNNFDIEKSSFKTWIFTIAKNTATDSLRKKRFLLFSEIKNINQDENLNSFIDTLPDENPLPSEIIDKLEDINNLNKVLNEMKEEQKEIMILHYQEDMTFNEISKVLNKPLNTVKSIHYRALLYLRNKLTI